MTKEGEKIFLSKEMGKGNFLENTSDTGKYSVFIKHSQKNILLGEKRAMNVLP